MLMTELGEHRVSSAVPSSMPSEKILPGSEHADDIIRFASEPTYIYLYTYI